MYKPFTTTYTLDMTDMIFSFVLILNLKKIPLVTYMLHFIFMEELYPTVVNSITIVYRYPVPVFTYNVNVPLI